MKNWAGMRCTQVFMYGIPYLFLSYFNGTWSFSTSFGKIHKYQVNENPSSGIRTVPCGRTDTQVDTTKITVAFRNSTIFSYNARTHSKVQDFRTNISTVRGSVISPFWFTQYSVSTATAWRLSSLWVQLRTPSDKTRVWGRLSSVHSPYRTFQK